MSEQTQAHDLMTHERLADFESVGEAFRPIPLEDVPAAVEALLFASGDPLTLEQLHRILQVDRDKLRRTMDELKDRYARDRSRGLLLREADGTFVLSTKPNQLDVLSRLFSPRHRPPLTPAAYETLAVIAYNQPVTRAQIEAVRGVNSDNVIARLVERNLIREVGNLDAPGRPALFATTDQFLLDFGLRSVADLPPMEMLMYGTLRDIEQSLEEAANRRRDNQVTIDQIVAAIVPSVQETSEADRPSERADEPVRLRDNSKNAENPENPEHPDHEPEDPDEVVDLSAALFGSNNGSSE